MAHGRSEKRPSATGDMAHGSITIVTWNSRDTVLACLTSIFRQSLQDFGIIVVDNASRDDTLQLIEQRYGARVRLITNASNEGYCRAHNTAIGLSNGEYVLTLNPDVVLTPTFLEHAVGALESTPDIGSVNGKLLRVGPEAFENGRFEIPPGELPIDSAGLVMFRTRRQFLRGYMEKDSGQFKQAAYIFGPDGAAALYRRDMLEDVKIDGQYFDESFFAHKEDVDLAWRAQLFGWKSLFAPNAVAFHVRGFKPGERRAMPAEIRGHAIKNRYLMLMKNEVRQTFWRDWLRILSYDLKILGYLLLFEQRSLLAFWHCLRLAPAALRWRRTIQSKRREDVGYLLNLFE